MSTYVYLISSAAEVVAYKGSVNRSRPHNVALLASRTPLAAMKSIHPVLLVSAALLSVTVASTSFTQGLTPKKCNNLPLGDVKPGGWLQDFLAPRAQVGKAEGFYQYLSRADTEWVARRAPVYSIEGAGSHWFNDMVTIAGISENQVLLSQTEQFLDYYIDTQDADGWLGPEVTTGRPRRLSARRAYYVKLPFLLGAMRIADAKPARADRIAAGLHRFVALVHDMLRRGEGLEDDASVYAGDLLVVLQWLYEFHPSGHEDVLMEIMLMLSQTGESLTPVFRERRRCDSCHTDSDKNFPRADPTQQHWQLPDVGIQWHAMNAAKALATLGARHRLSDNGSDDTAWDTILTPHGQPSGLFAPSMHIGRYWEEGWTHLTAETIRSVLYLYQVSGDLIYLENVERIAHAAVLAPQSFNLRSWGITSSLSLCRETHTSNGPYEDLLASSGDNPTCTAVLYPEGAFDLIYGAFLYTADRKSLIQVLPGPFTVNTTLAEDNQVVISVNSSYPYSWDTLSQGVIVAQKTFMYYTRIPKWSTGATISVNGSDPGPCSPVDGMHAFRVEPGTTNFTLNLPLDIVADQLRPGHVAVSRGPVLYAFDEWYPLGADNAIHRGMHYAIDPSTVSLSPAKMRSLRPIWRDAGHTLTVVACPTAGTKDNHLFAEDQNAATCVGPARNITLIPAVDAIFPEHAVREFPTFKISDIA
ncbi:hypothetical protein VTO73DRAFT_10445 [Trametes versicolor]